MILYMLPKTYNIQENDIHKDDYKYSRVIGHLLQQKGWTATTDNATYSAKNKKSVIKTYLDGTENIFLKHKLAHHFGSYYFIPKSYSIETPNDLAHVPTVANISCIWFLKPSSMLIGGSEGIVILKIKKGDKFRETVAQHIKKNTAYVLQRNITFPMLIDDVKFDLRIFCIMVYTPNEFAAYIINKGNIRFAVKKYRCNTTNKKRLVTNVSVHKNYNAEQIKKVGHQLTDIYMGGHHMFSYFPTIQAIFTKIIENTFNFYDKTLDYGFIFIGLDVLIDSQGQVYILEINQHPTLYDDASSVETAMNYIYHYGANHYIFKHFYDIVFDGIINNKLVAHNLGCYILTNYYKRTETIQIKQNIYSQANIDLYKFSSKNKDVNLFHSFLANQPFDHINPWGVRYTRSRCCKQISQSESNQAALLCGLMMNGFLVGVVGINCSASCDISGYFSHVLVDYNYQGKHIGKRGMQMLLEYIRQNNVFNIKMIYARILVTNKKSISLHKKIGFTEVKNVGYEVILSIPV